MTKLIADTRNPEIGISLAVFKPKEVIDFVWEKCDEDWNEDKLRAVYAEIAQGSLFDTEEEREARSNFKVAEKIPYEFSYIFTSDDGKTRKLMIEDWEVGALYRTCLNYYKCTPEEACQKVKQRYFDDFAKTKDLHFFLGTTLKFHNFAKNPYIIIGTFTPPLPKDTQPSLFDEF